MPLQERLDAIKAEFEAKAPPAALAIMRNATDMLHASGQAERAMGAGASAPNFVLKDADGAGVTLEELLQKGPLVLTFYRGIWCPYCNADLKALEEARPRLEALGASLAAVSPQTGANSRKTRRDLGLGFPILTDVGGEVASLFGLRWTLPEDLKTLYQQFHVDLPGFNGDQSWTLPMPARYVIGTDGIIRYSEVNPDYTHRPDPSVLFPVLGNLAG